MSEINADAQIKEATLEAVIIRADGTVENLGVIAQWQPEPSAVRRLLQRLKRN